MSEIGEKRTLGEMVMGKMVELKIIWRLTTMKRSACSDIGHNHPDYKWQAGRLVQAGPCRI